MQAQYSVLNIQYYLLFILTTLKMIFMLCIIAGLLLANLLSLFSNNQHTPNTPLPPPNNHDNKFQDYHNPKLSIKTLNTKEAGLHKEKEQHQQRTFYTLLFLFVIITLLLIFKE
jgi:hypothetical protein